MPEEIDELEIFHPEPEFDDDDPMMYDICPDCGEAYSVRQGCVCKDISIQQPTSKNIPCPSCGCIGYHSSDCEFVNN